ncbi:MAG: hypothetical protein Q8R01_15875 [Ramlibacter sp.]|nr:hypothetical protein [Ramlibacter sp.]
MYFRLARESPAVVCLCPSVDDDDPVQRQLEDLEPLPPSPKTPAPKPKEGLDAEREPNTRLGHAPRAPLTGAAGHQWHIFAGRPPMVHALAWAQLAPATRALHARWLHRIRGMPADLSSVPLPRAVLELVMRMAHARDWAWSTVASALSSAASALVSLPLYSTELNGVDIRSDPAYSAAMRRAQQNARISVRTSISEEMTPDVFRQLCGVDAASGSVVVLPSARLLLQVAWAFAGRIGDIRQLRPNDITFGAESPTGRMAVATFRFGKGAAFWGPYSVHSVLPAATAKDLVAFAAVAKPGEPMWTTRDQALLSATVRELGLTLRSVRRGALLEAARRGVADENLRLLSGHKRQDTLLRYLGWGVASASATAAALERARAINAPAVQAPAKPTAPPATSTCGTARARDATVIYTAATTTTSTTSKAATAAATRSRAVCCPIARRASRSARAATGPTATHRGRRSADRRRPAEDGPVVGAKRRQGPPHQAAANVLPTQGA